MGKLGTSTISLNELFKEEQLFINKKCSLLELKKIVADYKRKKYKVGFTNGCFDILHIGHINYLEESKKLCDKLIIAINSDSSVKKIKGKTDPSITKRIEQKFFQHLAYVITLLFLINLLLYN